MKLLAGAADLTRKVMCGGALLRSSVFTHQPKATLCDRVGGVSHKISGDGGTQCSLVGRVVSVVGGAFLGVVVAEANIRASIAYSYNPNAFEALVIS